MTKAFKNTSTEVFQDGNLVVAPGESFSTQDDARIAQMEGQYAWQFTEVKGDAPTEEEVKETPNDIREIASSSHVRADENGAQSEVVGSPQPAEEPKSESKDKKAK